MPPRSPLKQSPPAAASEEDALTAHAGPRPFGTPAHDPCFTLLSHSFRVKTSNTITGEMIDRFIGRFRCAPREGLPTYVFDDGQAGPKASFRLSLAGRSLKVSTVPERVLEHLLWHALSVAVTGSGSALVHAGVVSEQGSAVVLPGRSGAGKTTLTAGLLQAGFSFLSDELAAIDPETLLVHPFPRALCFKPGFVPLATPDASPLQEAGDGQLIVPVQPEDLGATAGAPAPVAFIVAPQYERGRRTRLVPITRAEGLLALAKNSFNLQELRTRAFDVFGRVAAGARCYRLEVGDLDEAVCAIRGMVEAGRSRDDTSEAGHPVTGDVPPIEQRLVVSPGWGRLRTLPLEAGQMLERGTVMGHVSDGGRELPLVSHAAGRFLRWLVADGERLPPGRAVALISGAHAH